MARTFEIGLTMAGAVSAGAYTAGVMDFFIEALDAYSKARKTQGWDGPTHDVRIPIMSGASAGGMTSSICALHFFRNAFDHLWPQDPAEKLPARRRNRLYSSWVEDIDIRRLLETSDIDGSARAPVRSLLCCDVIDQIVKDAFDMEGDIRAPEWIGRSNDPSLRVRLTVTNLRGVPYAFDIYGEDDPRRYGMLNHGDLLDFKIGIAPAAEPGVYALDIRDTTTPEWELFRTAAKATGAFPIGLAPRRISRDSSQYDYISCIRYGDGLVSPDPWIKKVNPYVFVAVDGGTIDNEPLEMTRRFLSGGADRINPNDGVGTDKAVILIAPFPNFLDAKTEEAHASDGRRRHRSQPRACRRDAAFDSHGSGPLQAGRTAQGGRSGILFALSHFARARQGDGYDRKIPDCLRRARRLQRLSASFLQAPRLSAGQAQCAGFPALAFRPAGKRGAVFRVSWRPR